MGPWWAKGQGHSDGCQPTSTLLWPRASSGSWSSSTRRRPCHTPRCTYHPGEAQCVESQRKAEQVTWAKFHVDLIGNTNPAVVWNLREPLTSTPTLFCAFSRSPGCVPCSSHLAQRAGGAFKAESVIVATAEQGIARVKHSVTLNQSTPSPTLSATGCPHAPHP